MEEMMVEGFWLFIGAVLCYGFGVWVGATSQKSLIEKKDLLKRVEELERKTTKK